MANSVDPDQTAPRGAVRSGSTLFALVKHQKILPRSNTQLYYNNGGHNNNLKTLRRFHDVDDVTVKDNQ